MSLCISTVCTESPQFALKWSLSVLILNTDIFKYKLNYLYSKYRHLFCKYRCQLKISLIAIHKSYLS